MTKVFWIDEDERIWAPERRLLSGLGFEVLQIGDATTAYRVADSGGLEGSKLIILDVMLLQGDDERNFSDENTDDGLNTGIVLARLIIKKFPTYRQRMLFFTRATEENHVNKIKAVAKELDIHYLPKGPKTQGRHFIKWLQDNGFITKPGSKT